MIFIFQQSRLLTGLLVARYITVINNNFIIIFSIDSTALARPWPS